MGPTGRRCRPTPSPAGRNARNRIRLRVPFADPPAVRVPFADPLTDTSGPPAHTPPHGGLPPVRPSSTVATVMSLTGRVGAPLPTISAVRKIVENRPGRPAHRACSLHTRVLPCRRQAPKPTGRRRRHGGGRPGWWTRIGTPPCCRVDAVLSRRSINASGPGWRLRGPICCIDG